MQKEKTTTIKLEKKTKERLDGLKEYEHETYNELINKILNIINITLKNPIAGARIFGHIKRKKLGKQNIEKRLIARSETRQEMEQEAES